MLSNTPVLPARPYSEDDSSRLFGMLSTFPPTSCGIATFSAALSAGLIGNGDSVHVIRLGSAPELEDSMVLGSIGDGLRESREKAIDILNSTDVAIIQHEYGLYEGCDGDDVLDLMEHISVPIMVVAHTVLSEPTANQRRVLEQVCAAADVVVVMTMTAQSRLLTGYEVEPSKVIVIPHGAATPLDHGAVTTYRPTNAAPRLLTWGLLGPGKGIEWAIDAIAELTDLDEPPNYIIAGATHPKIVEHSGEAYREMLTERAANSAAAEYVSFDDSYRDLASLTKLIHSADVVVLPYDSVDQVTSGVLVDAVAAGRPVISTAFPHAVELLASGAGIVVPQRDPGALADAIRSVLTDPDLAASMAAEARRLAPDLSWASVASRYSALAGPLVAEPPSIRL